MSDALDYVQWIHLDAEDLAEGGILKAYQSLLPELRRYVPEPAPVHEVIDDDEGRRTDVMRAKRQLPWHNLTKSPPTRTAWRF